MSRTKHPSLTGQCSAEFLGTGLLVLLGVGCVAGLKLTSASYGQWEISIIWGLAVALGVYLTAGVSGAHLNPAVTIALWLFGNFERHKILPYIGAQLLGGFFAAGLIYLLYYNLFIDTEQAMQIIRGSKESLATASTFSTYPNPSLNIAQAFMVELIITSILMGLILAITDDGNGVPTGPLAPLLIGLTVATIGGSFGPLTGFAMNPARDFGPKVLASLTGWGEIALTGGRDIPYFLVPILAPICGAVLGAFIYKRFVSRYVPSNIKE